MEMYVISDNIDTCIGLRLVGINGVVVSTSQELKEQFNSVLSNKDIAIVLVVENLAKQFPSIIKEVRLKKTLPLIVEIPNRYEIGRNKNFISSYVKESIGIKI